MKAEIICVGTELLLGQTVNTNATFIAQELHELGIDSHFQSVVGDNEKRIHEVLDIALKRSDLIITTGGLGPTADDLTHEALISYFNKKTVLDKKVLKMIEDKFKMRGYKKMPSINKKQAYKPKTAKWIDNKNGTANGLIWKAQNPHNSKSSALFLTFPGVPNELYAMWNSTAKKYLSKLSKDHIYSKTLKFTGIGESALAEKIKPFFNQKNPTVAPYAMGPVVKVRITAKSKSKTTAIKSVNSTIGKISKLTKEYLFSDSEDDLEDIIAKSLISKRYTLSIAESCTGGLISKRLTDISGSSKFLSLSAVTYSNNSKVKLLKVKESTLKKHGAVSSQTAREMALGIKNFSGSNIALSVTGIAGPTGGSKEKPIGLVYFGLAINGKVKTKKVLFGERLSRESIRNHASQYALNWIRKELA